jgi:phage shock protein PspC (stress-responsive transcriptional regulator)
MNRRHASPRTLFYRDTENGLILGVCAGLTDRFGFRLGPLRVITAVLLVLFTVPVAVVYLAAGLLLPGRPLKYYGRRDERELWGRRRARRMEA